MNKTNLTILAIITATAFFTGCNYDNFKELHPKSNACDTSNIITYQADVKAIMDANCVSCHGAGGTQPHLDTYQNIVAYSSDRILAALAPNAIKPMPPSSPLGQSDIDKIKQWVAGCSPYGPHVNSVCDTSAVTSFSADIMPILSANCTNGCHDHIGLGHGLLTYTDVLNDTFLVYKNNSYLVFSLIDTVPSKRMPLGRPNLSACQIAKIRRWVVAGSHNN
jgi:cytochrome c553